MKNVKSEALLEQLQADTREIIVKLKYLQQQEPALLLKQPAPGKWSAAQVVEHLNSYGRYYLPQLKKALETTNFPAVEFFTSGWLGGYFTRSMLPKENGTITHKMKAPKDHRPSHDINSKTVLDEFEQQELLLLDLLHQAKKNNIGRPRIPISIAPFIKLKMGDVFSFLIAHHQRHFVQIESAIGNRES